MDRSLRDSPAKVSHGSLMTGFMAKDNSGSPSPNQTKSRTDVFSLLGLGGKRECRDKLLYDEDEDVYEETMFFTSG